MIGLGARAIPHPFDRARFVCLLLISLRGGVARVPMGVESRLGELWLRGMGSGRGVCAYGEAEVEASKACSLPEDRGGIGSLQPGLPCRGSSSWLLSGEVLAFTHAAARVARGGLCLGALAQAV